MEGHVVLAHELGVGDVVGALVGSPPAFPIVPFASVLPFLRAGNVFDGGIKPDVENFAFHARPISVAFLDGHAPI